MGQWQLGSNGNRGPPDLLLTFFVLVVGWQTPKKTEHAAGAGELSAIHDGSCASPSKKIPLVFHSRFRIPLQHVTSFFPSSLFVLAILSLFSPITTNLPERLYTNHHVTFTTNRILFTLLSIFFFQCIFTGSSLVFGRGTVALWRASTDALATARRPTGAARS